MSWRLTAALVAIGALGCSGGGDAPTLFVCARVDMCATVPIERVNAACGTSATSAVPDGTAIGGNAIDICEYRSSNGDLFSIYHACFELAANAALTYRGVHDDTSGGAVREEIDGLGDSAFVRFNRQAMTSQLVGLRRNLYIFLTSYDVADADADAAKACMTAVASDLLAAQ